MAEAMSRRAGAFEPAQVVVEATFALKADGTY